MTMDELSGRIASVEERAKSNTHRLDAVESRIERTEQKVETVAVMASEQTHIKEDVAEIKTDVKELMSKSGKRWEMVVEKVIIAIISGIVGFCLFKIGFTS